jgi:hypothetical protein
MKGIIALCNCVPGTGAWRLGRRGERPLNSRLPATTSVTPTLALLDDPGLNRIELMSAVFD